VRINEIASAEEQIELWKLISNSVWQSLQQQEREEQQRNAAAAAARKNAPKGKRGRRSVGSIPSLPKVPAPKPPTPPQQPTPNKMAGTTPQSNAPQPAAPKPLAPASALPNAQRLPASLPANTQKSVKTAGFQPKYGQKKSDDDTDDRHSKNTFPRTLPNSAVRR
jgi:hypothetical protein